MYRRARTPESSCVSFRPFHARRSPAPYLRAKQKAVQVRPLADTELLSDSREDGPRNLVFAAAGVDEAAAVRRAFGDREKGRPQALMEFAIEMLEAVFLRASAMRP